MKRIDILICKEECTTILTDEPTEVVEDMLSSYKQSDGYMAWDEDEFYEFLNQKHFKFIPVPKHSIELNSFNY